MIAKGKSISHGTAALEYDILIHPEKAEEMKRHCLEIVEENQGATKKNLDELQRLLDEVYGHYEVDKK